jgi:hypothetical protein
VGGGVIHVLMQGFTFLLLLFQLLFQIFNISIEMMVLGHNFIAMFISVLTLTLEISDYALERLGCLLPDQFNQERSCGLYHFLNSICRQAEASLMLKQVLHVLGTHFTVTIMAHDDGT